jgi:DNA-binding NarL/FixJ family response regulator
MGVVRVVLAEDNVIVRAGIESLLEVEGDIVVVGVCAAYDELLEAVVAHQPDAVLTDICMPPTNTDEGIRAAVALRRSHPDVGVVVLSQYIEAAYALALVADGSQRRGYLLKERVAHRGQLVDAIHAVTRGDSYIDPLVVDSLVTAQSRSASSPLARLTRREREVLTEIAAGQTNGAIAKRLFVSDRAIEKHVNSIFSKLGLIDDGDVHRRVTAALLHLAEPMPPLQQGHADR